MKKLILTPLLLLYTLFCFAQKSEKRKGLYSMYLFAVEQPKGFEIGKLDTVLSTYEDANIKIDWDYAFSQLGFTLANKSEETIRVIWDEAAFISIENETIRVFHKGIKIIDRESPQPPTLIYKGTTLSDLVAPTTYTTYVSGQYGGWRSQSLIKTSLYEADERSNYYREDLTGKTIKVILPVKFGEKTEVYIFSFKTVFIDKKK